MPSITFEPTGVDAGWNFSLDGKAPPGAFDLRPGLGWAVKASDNSIVRLATGRTLDELPGRVWFRVGSATSEGREVYRDGASPIWGVLAYHESDENPDHYPVLPEAYSLTIHVSRSIFEALKPLVAARTLPAIIVSVGSSDGLLDEEEPTQTRSEAIRYGWEPDGSGLDWDNKKSRGLEIKWCEFRVDVGLPKAEDDESQPDRGAMPPTKGDVTQVFEAVKLSVQRLEQLGRALMLPLWIAVILLGILIYRR